MFKQENFSTAQNLEENCPPLYWLQMSIDYLLLIYFIVSFWTLMSENLCKGPNILPSKN